MNYSLCTVVLIDGAIYGWKVNHFRPTDRPDAFPDLNSRYFPPVLEMRLTEIRQATFLDPSNESTEHDRAKTHEEIHAWFAQFPMHPTAKGWDAPREPIRDVTPLRTSRWRWKLGSWVREEDET